MKFQKTILFIMCLFLVCMVRANVVTYQSMHDLSLYLKEHHFYDADTIIFFDLDNTLIHPKTEVGSNQWIEYEINQLVERQSVSMRQALLELLPLYYKVQPHIELCLIDPLAPQLINEFKEMGVLVFGLTARHGPIIDLTVEKLLHLELIFSHHTNDSFELESLGEDHQALFKSGIIFCGNNDKGKVVSLFLSLTNLKPKKIIVVDDKLHHLDQVKNMALALGIDCVCVHYTGCNERVSGFNYEKALQELAMLNLEK